jgi:FMN-dependent NADH-azoreductase
MKLLHLDSSILGGNSVSRQLSASIVARLKATHSGLEVVYRDLAAHPIPHLSGAYVAASRGGLDGTHEPALQADLALGEALMEEFLAADIVVIGVAFYNFAVSTQLKAWIDRIAVAGKTFRYTASGPEGLVGGKRLILAIARGGFYGLGSPARPMEHAETYLRGAFGLLGITAPEVIIAEGVNVGPEQREAALTAARDQISALEAA